MPRLRVLTWNVFLMMFPAKCPGKKKRTELIAKQILDQHRRLDIVCLQKVFDRDRARRLEKLLRRRFDWIFWDNDCPFGFTSGLFVASRVPLTLRASLNFKDATGFERLAPKGAMIFDGSVAGSRFQIVNTHLQGHPAEETRKRVERSDRVRRSQIAELAGFVGKHRGGPSTVQIVAGDFFVDKYENERAVEPTPDYRLIQRKLRSFDGDSDPRLLRSNGKPGPAWRVTSDTLDGNDFARDFVDERTIKDYVFVLDRGSDRVRQHSRAVMRFPARWSHGRRTYHFLSYRYAMKATIRFR